MGKRPKRGTYDGMVSHIDVLPTLCDLSGIETLETVSGASFAETIKTGVPFDRDRVFIQFDGNGALGNFQRCVIEGDFKLIVDTFKDEVFFDLCDVVNDPQELTNLAFEAQERVRSRYADHLALEQADYERFLQAYGSLRAN